MHVPPGSTPILRAQCEFRHKDGGFSYLPALAFNSADALSHTIIDSNHRLVALSSIADLPTVSDMIDSVCLLLQWKRV